MVSAEREECVFARRVLPSRGVGHHEEDVELELELLRVLLGIVVLLLLLLLLMLLLGLKRLKRLERAMEGLLELVLLLLLLLLSGMDWRVCGRVGCGSVEVGGEEAEEGEENEERVSPRRGGASRLL